MTQIEEKKKEDLKEWRTGLGLDGCFEVLASEELHLVQELKKLEDDELEDDELENDELDNELEDNELEDDELEDNELEHNELEDDELEEVCTKSKLGKNKKNFNWCEANGFGEYTDSLCAQGIKSKDQLSALETRKITALAKAVSMTIGVSKKFEEAVEYLSEGKVKSN
ncbi:mature-parasite-infected erythrocyte surface antigen, partial [Reticulomyxa filosa]